MRTLIHISVRAVEAALKTAEAGHTSAAAIIFLGHINANGAVEVALGVLSVFASALLVWELVRIAYRAARGAAKRGDPQAPAAQDIADPLVAGILNTD